MSERKDEKDDDVFVDVRRTKLPASVQRQNLDASVQLQDRTCLVETDRILSADLWLEPDEVDLDQERSGCLLDDVDRHRVRIADLHLEKERLHSLATFGVDRRDFECRRSKRNEMKLHSVNYYS